VSFIQTCMQIVPTCLPEPRPGHVLAATMLGPAGLWNLVGYVIGAVLLSPLADRLGRRTWLSVAMLVTGIGSFASAAVSDYTLFVVTRWFTGIGIGTVLAVVNTYISEVSPRTARARNTAIIFTLSGLGALMGIWGGLLLTTPPTPFPLGLPAAFAGEHFTIGWRLMYVVGGIIGLAGLAIPALVPESPRWLVSRGELPRAERIVAAMERRAGDRARPTTTAADTSLFERSARSELEGSGAIGYAELFKSALYRYRLLVMFLLWFVGYGTVYLYSAGFTVILSSLGYTPPEAGMIAAFGVFGFVACGPVTAVFGERLERKNWLPVAAVITLIGGVIVATAPSYLSAPGPRFAVECIGSVLIFFGFNVWVPMTYTWSSENFPTRARATGFALVDGAGHLGGGVALIALLPLVPALGPLGSLTFFGGLLVLAAIIARFGIATRARTLEELAPEA
jgi:MFS transporter, putative metabolite:H+ symporter